MYDTVHKVDTVMDALIVFANRAKTLEDGSIQQINAENAFFALLIERGRIDMDKLAFYAQQASTEQTIDYGFKLLFEHPQEFLDTLDENHTTN